jgi:long-chain fatty acid transport protein
MTPDQNWAIVPFLGVASDLGTKSLRAGLALYAPNLYGASLPEDAPSRYHLTRGFFFATHLTGTLAWKVNEHFAIGAGVSAVYMVMQGAQYQNPMVLLNPDLRFDTPDSVRARDLKVSLDGRGWTWDWNVGVLIHPVPTLGIGISFTSGADVLLKGDVTIRPADASKPTQTIGQTTRMAIPLTLRFGVNWEFVKDFQVGLDFSWWHYQVFQEQVMELERPIEGMPGTVQRTPKNFHNAWNLGGGFLYRVIPELDLMIGVQRDTSPIPTQTMTVDNLNKGLTSLSVGARWRPLRWLGVGVTYMRSWADLLVIQDSVTSPSTNGKGHGGMNHVSAEFTFKL